MDDFGVLLINKPPNITSFDVVRKLRKITGLKKIGHTGTLDPFATGLMQLCIGKATRIAGKLTSEKKTYEVTCQLGIKTDTGDTTGKVIAEKEIPDISEKVLKNLQTAITQITSQIPHNYSAVKIAGKRAYNLARKNEKIVLKSRPIKIFSFDIQDFKDDKISYLAQVSKGTYIRVLSETIAQKLGTIGTTIKLNRTHIGNIDIAQSVKLDELESENWKNHLISLPTIFSSLSQVNLDDDQKLTFQHGNFVVSSKKSEGEVIVLDDKGDCLGFGNIDNYELKPKIVFI
ncbi:MAG: tRNA pseudouridine(55) synthase TruB [Candidatus Cloacimonetes bacterium]|nr:tRNA pseudouridine(55) synthase TruB [Candidatus Cloacimonadota bacterium]